MRSRYRPAELEGFLALAADLRAHVLDRRADEFECGDGKGSKPQRAPTVNNQGLWDSFRPQGCSRTQCKAQFGEM